VTLAQQALPQERVHPNGHVIAGDILSPAMTEPLVKTILNWVADSL
jgi:hypothetical protein